MEKTFNYQRVYDGIKGAILSGQYLPGDRLPTESELQGTYGVSRITVKKAMEMLCEENLVERFPGKGTFVLGARSVPAPKKVQDTQNKIIGCVMSGFSNYFGQDFIRGVAEEANRQGYSLMMGFSYSTMEEERAIMDNQIANGAQGIIAMPIHDGTIINTNLVERAMEGFPLVLADRYFEGIPLPYIGSDHADAAFQATQYLFSLGHQKIGLVSPIPSTTAITEREAGYMRAYAMTNYQVHPNYLVPDLKSGMPGMNNYQNFREDTERMKRYYRENPEVTALLCIDHNTMEVCRTAAQELGIRVPEELSLICFDAAYTWGGGTYTHIHQPEQEMGRQAVRMLLDVMSGKREVRHVLMPAVLQVGDSTCPPNR